MNRLISQISFLYLTHLIGTSEVAVLSVIQAHHLDQTFFLTCNRLKTIHVVKMLSKKRGDRQALWSLSFPQAQAAAEMSHPASLLQPDLIYMKRGKLTDKMPGRVFNQQESYGIYSLGPFACQQSAERSFGCDFIFFFPKHLSIWPKTLEMMQRGGSWLCCKIFMLSFKVHACSLLLPGARRTKTCA